MAATVLSPARRSYRGSATDPGRWAGWVPRAGDILVCTPPKCGTTWTQTILTMLVHGRPDLPAPVPVLSPWIDADLGEPADMVADRVAAQTGRRVLKTHTPGDGFPVWEGVTVIAVYRHPLDLFFSLRKHTQNMMQYADDDEHPMKQPVARSLELYLDGVADPQDFDRDTLATLAWHFRETVLSGRVAGGRLFHYADMAADGRAAVARLAEAAGIAADAALIDRVAGATTFGAMKAAPEAYAPVAGTGFWKSDAGFFDAGTSGKWEGRLDEAALARYAARLAELVPDAAARAWLEGGGPWRG